MKRLAEFLVNRNKIIFGVFLALAVAGLLLMSKVNIITDMTEFLPDDSSMRIGIDKMEEEFPNSSMNDSTIRVMFTGLADDEKEAMAEELEQVIYVDSVDYEADDDAYNKGEYTLYELTVPYKDTSDEVDEVKNVLEEQYVDSGAYTAEYEVSNSTDTDFPIVGVIAALLILIGILFVLCPSWVEPFLYLFTIGVAVLINMGTNAFLSGVSNTTHSIAAILQLVLSMDYSIILMNRYRQELRLTIDRREAMKNTIKNVFSSVTSSAVTTIVGMIMLVFMSFKIGQDMGIVLAKGVFFSLICVFTVLPTLILLFDKWIFKFGKKVPLPPMKPLAAYSYKLRRLIVPVFAFLFIAAFLLRGNTGITYINDTAGHINEVFPDTNDMVILYNNEDEEKMTRLLEELKEDKNVDSVASYGTTIGKQYHADELVDELEDMDDFDTGDMKLTDDVMQMLYYYHFTNGKMGEITASNLMNFIAEDVLENETFADEMDDSVKDNKDKIKKFADKEALSTKMSFAEMADFFDMKEDQAGDLYLYYYIKNGGVSTGTMNIRELITFILDDVANDPDYGSEFDAGTLSQMEQLRDYTDLDVIGKKRTYEDVADFLSMDAEQAKLLYASYFAAKGNVDAGTKTFPELVSFLTNDVLSNDTLSSQMSDSQKTQMQSLSHYADKNEITSQKSAAALASAFSMKTTDVQNLFLLKASNDMSEQEMAALQQEAIDEVSAEVAAEVEEAATKAAETAAKEAAEEAAQKAAQEATPTEEEVTSRVQARVMEKIAERGSAELPSETEMAEIQQEVVQEIQAEIAAEVQKAAEEAGNKAGQEAAAKAGQEAAAAATPSEEEITALVEAKVMEKLSEKAADVTMSETEFVDFLINDVASNEQYASMLDQDKISSLKQLQSMMNLTISGKQLSASEAAELFGMDTENMTLLYLYSIMDSKADSYRVSVHELVSYILQNEDLVSGSMSSSDLSQLKTLKKIMDAAADGTEFTADGMADLLGMTTDQSRMLYTLYRYRNGQTEGWRLTPAEFIHFLDDQVLSDPDMSDRIDADSRDDLESGVKIIDAVLSGKKYTAAEMMDLMSGLGGNIDQDELELLYIYYFSKQDFDPAWTMSFAEFIDCLNEEALQDSRFAGFFEDDVREDLADAQEQIRDAAKQLRGPNNSLGVVSTWLPLESDDTLAFIDELKTRCDETFGEGNYHLIGNSAMAYEMSQTFRSELNKITILTALAIFLVVLLTFRSLSIPAILVLLIQTAVYVMMASMGLRNMSINYLALLIVQSILMGATIDYGILYTNQYRENRKTKGIRESLLAAYNGSIHTIMTSGLILIIVTFIMSYAFADPTIGQICGTISIGALTAVILILLILPGTLALFDKVVCKKGQRADP